MSDTSPLAKVGQMENTVTAGMLWDPSSGQWMTPVYQPLEGEPVLSNRRLVWELALEKVIRGAKHPASHLE